MQEPESPEVYMALRARLVSAKMFFTSQDIRLVHPILHRIRYWEVECSDVLKSLLTFVALHLFQFQNAISFQIDY